MEKEYPDIESEFIHIGGSDVWVCERSSWNGEEYVPRLVFTMAGEYGAVELDAWDVPNSDQAQRLITLLTKYL